MSIVPFQPSATSGDVVAWCDQTATWLQNTHDLAESSDALAQITVIEAAVRAKDMADEAQQAAAALRFKAERRVGEMIRLEREAGALAGQGRPKRHLNPVGENVPTGNVSPEPATLADHGISRKDAAKFTAYAETPDDEFEEAIEEAKVDGGLTRANLDRKLNPDAAKRPDQRWIEADRWIDRAKKLAADVDQLAVPARFGIYPGEGQEIVGQAARRHLANLKTAINNALQELNR